MKSNLIKKTLAIVTFLSMTAMAPIFAQGSSEVSKDARIEIEQLNKSIEKAILKKTLSDIPAMYTDDATILNPGGKKLHGRKEIAAFWYDFSNCKDFKSEITELGGNGKMIYQVGKWTMTMEKDGKLVTYTSDVVLVWKRESSYDYKIQLQSLNNTVSVIEDQQTINSAQQK
jgi:ketosteroid isomerase-like protein